MVEFAITAAEALIIVILALLVYISRKDNFLNRTFSLFLILLALWLLCGFPHLLVAAPSSAFVTLEFRIAHCLAILATGVFFLFSVAFYNGERIKKTLFWFTVSSAVILAFCCLSDLIVRRVYFEQGRFYIENGSLFPLFPFFLIVFGGGGLVLIALKRRRSTGTDRARAIYILLGFGLFLLISIILVIVIPAIMGSDSTSDYPFFLVIIPTGFTVYAIVKHRLLDVRLAVRRWFAYLITILIFGAPLVILYSIFRFTLKANPDLEMAISIAILAAAVALSPTVLRWANKVASRLFFTGLYDEIDLLHSISAIFTATANIRDGLIAATSLICERLDLQEITIVIPDEVTRGKGNWILGSRWKEDNIAGYQRLDKEGSILYQSWDTLLVSDDFQSKLDDKIETANALLEMDKLELAACLPIKGPAGKIGVLMAGNKRGNGSLDPIDLDFLSQFSERAGLFIENYLLSTYLLTQFEELSDTRKRLEESDRFKTDIITITSHEFRTPLTILNGYAFMLRDHYERFTEDERRQYLEYITSSCDRLTSILNQFMTVSYFHKGEMELSEEPTLLSDLFNEIKAGFNPEQGGRIESEVVPGNIRVRTDRSYLALLLKNLVENAIRFSPAGHPVKIRAESKDSTVSISVQDFGEGIEPNEVQSIFEPFTRLEDVDQHRIGTGLGLYIVRLIADLLGTEIDVDTGSSSGTTFYFKLPTA